MGSTMKKIFARVFLALTLLFIVAGAPKEAHAQDNKAQAQERFKRGIQLYEEENFSAALVEFKKAYELVPAYQVLFNIARTCYQLRDYVCALKNYDRYLAEGGNEVDAARKDEVEKEIGLVNRRLGTLTITTTKGASITVDGVAIGEAPLPAPLKVNEGRRLVRATMAGRDPAEKTLDVSGGDTINIDLPLREAGSAGPTQPPPTEAKSGTPWWLFGVAGVFAVGAGVTGALALSASSEAEDIRTKGGSVSDYDSAESRMRALGITADILGLVAIGTGVAAVVITLTQPSSSKTGKLHRAAPLGAFTF